MSAWRMAGWLAGWMAATAAVGQEAGLVKPGISFYPPEVVDRLRAHADQVEWIGRVREGVLRAADPWLECSDEELWDLMFGPGITRSWMVWSNGHCPACGEEVPMYNWEIDALERPWKARCPHCQEVFPKNDFQTFYRSGLNPQGLFDPALADRSLLFNAEHPDPNDPLHLFGVDDGEGFVERENRWRFIGAYLIYGQWKQAVLSGVKTLAAAHLLTGDPACAHKAAILLDRIADFYPTFDYSSQALTYEKALGSAGYVSVWHDACQETQEMAMAYAIISEAMRDDAGLVAFLSGKARETGLENPKDSIEAIQRNIEDRIFRDALAHEEKIHSNYPRTETAKATLLIALGAPEDLAKAGDLIGAMIEKATAVDGVTGEKGLANYSAFVIQSLAQFLGEIAKADPEFLPNLLKAFPQLRDTYRFHIDTWCCDRYYPLSGDTGWFAAPNDRYVGMLFSTPSPAPGPYGAWDCISPSSYSLLWQLYEATGDIAFAQTLFRLNGDTIEGLPHDLYAASPRAIQQGVLDIVNREGTDLRLESIDKQQWHLAILRSGRGAKARAAWLDYDSGGGHSHADGMNLGLFAKGLDLMPDFGYPPVQFGGWDSPRSRWYQRTAAHNTVLVDEQNTGEGAGSTTLWAQGRHLHAMRAAGPEMNQGRRYERTVLLVDVSSDAAYLLDIFRVVGGARHTKFTHSHFGEAVARGLALEPAEREWPGTEMRNWRLDENPEPGWQVDWTIEDRYGLLEEGARVHLRYTDLTPGASGGLVDGWVVAGSYGATETTWIPRAVTLRTAKDDRPLQSTFIAAIEPYEEAPLIERIERIPLVGSGGAPLPENHIGLRIALPDGRCDWLITRDPEDLASPCSAGEGPAKIETDADLAFLRFAASGALEYAVVCHGRRLALGGAEIRFEAAAPLTEIDRDFRAPTGPDHP